MFHALEKRGKEKNEESELRLENVVRKTSLVLTSETFLTIVFVLLIDLFWGQFWSFQLDLTFVRQALNNLSHTYSVVHILIRFSIIIFKVCQ
jgi:hypothetical protein